MRLGMVSLHPSIHPPTTHRPTHPTIQPSIHSSVYLPIHLFIHPFISSPTQPAIHPFICSSTTYQQTIGVPAACPAHRSSSYGDILLVEARNSEYKVLNAIWLVYTKVLWDQREAAG